MPTALPADWQRLRQFSFAIAQLHRPTPNLDYPRFQLGERRDIFWRDMVRQTTAKYPNHADNPVLRPGILSPFAFLACFAV